ncbi:MAG TPA: DUF6544 family protein [Saprospiraceae bacterium]|nr:DUF6544 family protein [Saprospiraceae bacterium]
MVFSILLLLITLLITLDSIGSKRLRSRVIGLAKTFFAQAEASSPVSGQQAAHHPPLLKRYLDYACPDGEVVATLRMRYKAAARRADRKNWQPIEAKLFLTTSPWQMVQYEDRTLAFLVSQKRFRLVAEAKTEQSQRLFSLFSQPTAPDVLARMHQWACLVWQPGHPAWTSLDWSLEDSQSVSSFLAKEKIHITWKIDKESGQLTHFQAKAEEAGLSLNYTYTDYEEQGAYQVPMSFEMAEVYADKQYLYRAQLVDLVYDEDFAWW